MATFLPASAVSGDTITFSAEGEETFGATPGAVIFTLDYGSEGDIILLDIGDTYGVEGDFVYGKEAALYTSWQTNEILCVIPPLAALDYQIIIVTTDGTEIRIAGPLSISTGSAALRALKPAPRFW